MRRIAAFFFRITTACLATACAGPDPVPAAPPTPPPTVRSSASTTAPDPASRPPTPTTNVVGDDAKPVRDVALSPDGAQLALLRENDVLELVDARTGSRLRAVNAANAPRSTDRSAPLRFSDDGRTVIRGSRGWSVPRLDPVTPPVVTPRAEQRDETTVAIRELDGAPTAPWLVAARKLRLTVTHEPPWTSIAASGQYDQLHVARDGEWIWRSGLKGVDVLHLPTGRTGHFEPWTTGISGMELRGGGDASVDFGPMSDRFIVYSTSQQGAMYAFSEARLVDASTMRPIESLQTDCQPNPTTWSPNGRWVLRRECMSRAVIVHDGRTGRFVRADQQLEPKAFSRDERLVAGVTDDGACVVDMETGDRKLFVPGGGSTTSWLAFTPDGGALVTRRGDRVTRWDLRSGAHASLATRWAPTTEPAIDPTASFTWQLRGNGSDIVDLASLTLRHVEGSVREVRPDGVVVSVDRDERVRISRRDGSTVGVVAIARGGRRSSVAVSDGGRWAAIAREEDARVELFDVAARRSVFAVETMSRKRPPSRYEGTDGVDAMSFRPGHDEVALLRRTWEGLCTLTIASPSARKVVRSIPVTECSRVLAWTQDGAHLLLGGGETLEAYGPDLATPPRVLAKTSAYRYPGPLERLVAALPDVDAIARWAALPPVPAGDAASLTIDPTRRFGARDAAGDVMLVRLADDRRVRLFSGQVWAHTGAIVIGPDATFDTSSPEMEQVLQSYNQPLTDAQRTERRRPGLLRTFVGEAR